MHAEYECVFLKKKSCLSGLLHVTSLTEAKTKAVSNHKYTCPVNSRFIVKSCFHKNNDTFIDISYRSVIMDKKKKITQSSH